MAERQERPKQTLMDYMVIGISPALIMAMVGSLLFFLVTVFYHGQYEGRLTFIFAMFVMAIVLIARISMEEGIEYAILFAIPLALVTMMAMSRFVQIQGPLANYSMVINIGLIALVWWSAHKLTWDCTLIDDSEDASGEGLLQGLGFDADTVESQASGQSEEAAGATAAAGRSESKRESQVDGVPLWWQRMVDRRRRPHTPGVWVVYYALAALPLFAFGQWLLPDDDASGRYSAFRFLVIYVGSALGLLLTTSFLGLRRYLRQRQMEMPADMAGLWLGIGALMIVGLLVFCLVLPRPGAAARISQLPISFGSPDHNRTHRNAIGNDGPERPEQADRTRQDAEQSGSNAPTQEGAKGDPAGASKGKGKGASQSGQKGGSKQQGGGKQQGNNKSQGGKQSGSQSGEQKGDASKGKSGGQSKDGQSKGSEGKGGDGESSQQQSDNGQGKQASDQGGQQEGKKSASSESAKSGGAKQAQNQKGKGQEASKDQSSGDNPEQSGKQRQSDQQQKADQQQKTEQQQRTERQQQQENRKQGQRSRQDSERSKSDESQKSRSNESAGTKSSSSGTSGVSRMLSRIAGGFGALLKLILWAVLIGVLVYFGWKHRERVMEAVRQLIQDIRDLLARLFGGGRHYDEEEEESARSIEATEFKPFASYTDPFATGGAKRYSTEQLVRYTFEALEAWARDQAAPRHDEQTPLEFAQQLAMDYPHMGVEAQQLADLYSRVAYGHERLSSDRQTVLRQVWQQMRAAAAVPTPPAASAR